MANKILRTKHNKYCYYAVRCPYKYRVMADSNGYVMLHRLVMAEFIGRPLYKSEQVRHKDGNTLNNEIENLKIVRSKCQKK
jgi:hypothetical protein